MRIKVYHGTPTNAPLIRAGSYVSPKLERSAKYARYPGNGEGNELGYIFELSIEASQVDWDEDRTDCRQGRLRFDVIADRWAVCDVPLDTANRQSPIKIKLDGTCIWATGKSIEWKFVNK